MSDIDFLPPASFEFLVLSMKMQAEVQLGLMHFGEEDERPEPNLPLARHTIDMLGVLLEKTKGNLSSEEHRLLDNALTELRFRYVYATEEAGRKRAEGTTTEDAPPKAEGEGQAGS